MPDHEYVASHSIVEICDLSSWQAIAVKPFRCDLIRGRLSFMYLQRLVTACNTGAGGFPLP